MVVRGACAHLGVQIVHLLLGPRQSLVADHHGRGHQGQHEHEHRRTHGRHQQLADTRVGLRGHIGLRERHRCHQRPLGQGFVHVRAGHLVKRAGALVSALGLCRQLLPQFGLNRLWPLVVPGHGQPGASGAVLGAHQHDHTLRTVLVELLEIFVERRRLDGGQHHTTKLAIGRIDTHADAKMQLPSHTAHLHLGHMHGIAVGRVAVKRKIVPIGHHLARRGGVRDEHTALGINEVDVLDDRPVKPQAVNEPLGVFC